MTIFSSQNSYIRFGMIVDTQLYNCELRVVIEN